MSTDQRSHVHSLTCCLWLFLHWQSQQIVIHCWSFTEKVCWSWIHTTSWQSIPSPKSLATPGLASATLLLPLLELHGSSVEQFMSFWFWLLSVSRLLRQILIVDIFCFVLLSSFPFNYHNLFISSPSGKNFGLFWLISGCYKHSEQSERASAFHEGLFICRGLVLSAVSTRCL